MSIWLFFYEPELDWWLDKICVFPRVVILSFSKTVLLPLLVAWAKVGLSNVGNYMFLDYLFLLQNEL